METQHSSYRNKVIVISVPIDISLIEIQNLMESCGSIKNIIPYKIPGMIEHPGTKDYCIEYNEYEGMYIALKISGTQYKHWIVETKTIDGYERFKHNEKIDENLRNSFGELVDNVVNFFKNEFGFSQKKFDDTNKRDLKENGNDSNIQDKQDIKDTQMGEYLQEMKEKNVKRDQQYEKKKEKGYSIQCHDDSIILEIGNDQDNDEIKINVDEINEDITYLIADETNKISINVENDANKYSQDELHQHIKDNEQNLNNEKNDENEIVEIIDDDGNSYQFTRVKKPLPPIPKKKLQENKESSN